MIQTREEIKIPSSNSSKLKSQSKQKQNRKGLTNCCYFSKYIEKKSTVDPRNERGLLVKIQLNMQ